MFTRIKDERGFSLIELLVVVLIIGVLAGIALPVYLAQRNKGQDADAQSNARNLVAQVESCGVETDGDYTNCATASELGNPGLPLGTSPGQVAVSSPGSRTYTVTAYSKTGKQFIVTKTASGVSRTTANPTGTW